MQRASIVFTLLAPLVLWLICRRYEKERLRVVICRMMALALLAFDLSNLVVKISEGQSIGHALPMQLCDWALLAMAGALWFRWQAAFELGYFWGLAGTVQALLTPAIPTTDGWWRLFGFFFSHALIVVSVLHLLLTERCRPSPRALWHAFIGSEVYLVAALLVNAATGANYGFLSHRPAQPTLLDQFSDTRWLYIAQINGLGLLLFAALYLPWWIAARCSRRNGSCERASGPL